MPNAFFKSWSPLPLRAPGSGMEAAACSLGSCLRSQCHLRPRASNDDVRLHRPVHHLCRSGLLRKCKYLRVVYAISASLAQSVRQRWSLRRKLAQSHAACLIAGLATALPDRASEYSVGSIKTSFELTSCLQLGKRRLLRLDFLMDLKRNIHSCVHRPSEIQMRMHCVLAKALRAAHKGLRHHGFALQPNFAPHMSQASTRMIW